MCRGLRGKRLPGFTARRGNTAVWLSLSLGARRADKQSCFAGSRGSSDVSSSGHRTGTMTGAVARRNARSDGMATDA
jgi:hypothetical protein